MAIQTPLRADHQDLTLPPNSSWIDRLLWFCLKRKFIVFLMTLLIVYIGIVVAPFDWDFLGVPRYPVPVDAVPDIGENQQVVYTEWTGRSPQDVQDQITYPLTTSLLGIPGVKVVRGISYFGFSNVYIIFRDDIDFYWSRSRVLEKLSSLPAGLLPPGVQPKLGPDATGVGQVMWYLLEGRDAAGNPTGGWDLHELRSVQDWYVRYGLLSVEGISEVASVGGFVREFQVDVDPTLMRANGVTLEDVVSALRRANIDVGASTIEVNKVEYIVRGLGFIKGTQDIENTVIKTGDTVPVFVRNVANVTYGPASRSGALDKGGAETVGGIVVVRHGVNPLDALKNVHQKIEEMTPGLPRKVLADGTESSLHVVPFYDRSGLIYETLGTLQDAISEEILVAVIVILLVMMHLESSLLVSAVLPMAVLISFIAMKIFGVDANIVALSGIAIAIGTLDDMGIVICENIQRHMGQLQEGDSRLNAVFRAASEVGGAVLAAAAATIVSFLPVFALEGAEGKLFQPLAFTKTFALIGSAVIAVMVIPVLAEVFFSDKEDVRKGRWLVYESLIYLGVVLAFLINTYLGMIVAFIGLWRLVVYLARGRAEGWLRPVTNLLAAAAVALVLARHWLPFGPEKGLLINFMFVATLVGGLVGFFLLVQHYYSRLLGWCLQHKGFFLVLPALILAWGVISWIGFAPVYRYLPGFIKNSAPITYLAQKFPGLGREFMPSLDEGSFLFMPVTMPHASIGEALDILQKQDTQMAAIPEVELVVGKLGRSESALDPAPTAMIETFIRYKPRYLADVNGRIQTFRFFPKDTDLFRDQQGIPVKAPDGKPYLVRGRFARDDSHDLIPDPYGKPFSLWRPALNPILNPGRTAWGGIQSPEDIWKAITSSADLPGTTRAPMLQPIAARIVMLQSGIRAAMGVRVKGPDLETVETACKQIEKHLREVPSIVPSSVIADRIIGKPYVEVKIDRRAVAQYEMDLQQVQDAIEVAIGGEQIMTTVEGRERYAVRVRYLRELRDELHSLGTILVSSPQGAQVPLSQLAEIQYARGPETIKTEDTFLVGYVLFDRQPGFAEADVVEQARNYLKYMAESHKLELPSGTTYAFTGNYENQIRAEKKLKLILPIVLFIIFMILYLQFNSLTTTLLVFLCIPLAWAGGFILMWLYGQPWFMNFSVFETNLRELFQIQPINLSIAVWVGFLALFGIAADDNIVMTTYLEQRFQPETPRSREAIRQLVIEAGQRRIRPCLMTTATTILALLPVLTSTGRGSDLMIPMAIPSFGGLLFELITMFVVPVLYCAIKEQAVKNLSPGGQ